MAQNITIMGASYSAVPAVTLPKTGGGTARFDDASVTTATAADVASGKVFLAADGTITSGTASGGGSPIAAAVVVEDGAYNSAVSTWYSSMQRYAVGQWTMTKSVFTSSPNYTTSGTQNQGVTTAIYKNSTSSSTSYTRTSGMNTNVFSSSNATNAALTCVRFKSSTSMTVYINTSSYGLLPGLAYRYFIVYSS